MATLQTPGDVKHNSFVDIKPINKVAGLWVVRLRSSSDLLTVPGLDSTSAVGSLTSGITASNFYIDEGQSLLTITGGSDGDEAVIATLHRKGFVNNLSRDDDPTY